MNVDGEMAPIFLAGVLLAVRELSRLGLLVKQKSNGGTHQDKIIAGLDRLDDSINRGFKDMKHDHERHVADTARIADRTNDCLMELRHTLGKGNDVATAMLTLVKSFPGVDRR